MKIISLKTKSPQAKNRIVVILAVLSTIIVIVLWLFLLSITKPTSKTPQVNPLSGIRNQIGEVINNGKLEKISETQTELQNTLDQAPQALNTPAEPTVSTTP
jgi:predicted PurR-regulated permease PerM